MVKPNTLKAYRKAVVVRKSESDTHPTSRIESQDHSWVIPANVVTMLDVSFASTGEISGRGFALCTVIDSVHRQNNLFGADLGVTL